MRWEKKTRRTTLEEMMSRTTQLTEWQAWVALAMMWSDEEDVDHEGGICDCISEDLAWGGYISEETRDKMHDRMIKHKPRSAEIGLFWWPPHENHKERSNFCWKMAKVCDKENMR
jgi:hypothetical protein